MKSAKDPELYEVDLQGDMFLQRATKERISGNYKEADRYYSMARDKFSEATKVARSDGEVMTGFVEHGTGNLHDFLFRQRQHSSASSKLNA
jgi:hypothetical protein